MLLTSLSLLFSLLSSLFSLRNDSSHLSCKRIYCHSLPTHFLVSTLSLSLSLSPSLFRSYTDPILIIQTDPELKRSKPRLTLKGLSTLLKLIFRSRFPKHRVHSPPVRSSGEEMIALLVIIMLTD